jgi:hypothetical protein
MSSLVDAFKQSQRKVNARAVKPSGNIILKPTKFTDKTVIGEVMSGMAAGQEIEIEVPNNGPRSVSIKKMTTKSNATTSSYVDIENGGTIRVERVREGANGVYGARWMNVFDGRPEEGSEIVYDALVQLRTTRSKVEGEPDVMRLVTIYPEDAKNASNMAELEEKIAEAFSEKGGAHIFFKEEGVVGSFSYGLGGTMQPEGWVDNDPKERAAFVIDSFGDNRALFEKAISETPFSVVPSKLITVGKTTGAEIVNAIDEARQKGEPARISTIEPSSFNLRSTGLRVFYALNESTETSGLSKDAGEKLKAKFLEVSSEEAKASFLSTKSGWAGVSNDDMRRFFESQGVELREYPDTGWSRQNILLKKGVATKAFGQNDAAPFPNLEICKDAMKEYRTEIFDAIRSVVEAPVKAAEAEAPKGNAAVTPKADVADPVTDAVSTEADIDDLDALLDGVQDADMGA